MEHKDCSGRVPHFLRSNTKTVPSDAHFLRSSTKTVPSDAYFLRFSTKTVPSDAYFLRSSTKTVPSDALAPTLSPREFQHTCTLEDILKFG
jgi:hypothetical protein